MRAWLVTALVVATGCLGRDTDSDKHAAPATSPGAVVAATPHATRDVTGTLTIDGRPQVVTACRAGSGFGTYVELMTASGKLRFEAKTMYWEPRADSVLRGDPLPCRKLDRSWGGGKRGDGTAYFRGKLIFDCGAIAGDLDVSCGNITPAEHAELDKNQAAARAERARSNSAPASHP